MQNYKKNDIPHSFYAHFLAVRGFLRNFANKTEKVKRQKGEKVKGCGASCFFILKPTND